MTTDDESSPQPGEPVTDSDAAGWLFVLPPDAYQQLVDGYEEAASMDPASPLTGFLEAWIRIERSKQSLLELLS